MKTIDLRHVFTAVVVGLPLLACEPKKQNISGEKESVEIAKEANDSTFTNRKDEKDADFVAGAVASNYGVIKMAQLARNKSVDQGVKDMANKLEADHSKTLLELKAYADKKGIAVPLEEGPEDSKDIDDLDKLSVDKFDKAWWKAMERRHKKSIDRFQLRMDRTEDAELRDWISTTLQGLNDHLLVIQNASKKNYP